MSIAKKTVKIFLLAFILCLLPLPTKGQEITPDGTTATQVNSADGSNFDINGGDRAGGNLFHSFGKFGVPTGGAANFLNSPDVENIINRVTGSNVSNIDGLIKANGGANLFLINPAGIIFGQNARLDIGGSFLGTTADSLLFNDGTEFSAVNSQGKPLLTINAPIGLNFRDTPGDIINRSKANDEGLAVRSDKNITLVGGNIGFEGGFLTAPGGRVELGGLRVAGEVKFNENGGLIFPNGLDRGDVALSNGAFVDVRSDGGGFITVNAKNLKLSDKSNLFAGIGEGLGTTGTVGGDINFNVTDNIIASQASRISNRVNENATGDAGDINIQTGSLTLTEESLFSSIIVGQGNAGNINITTGNFTLTNGAQLSSIIVGQGNAGNIIINARDAVTLDGKSSDGKFESAIGSIIGTGGKGKAGNIEITTGNLGLTNDAQLSSSTSGTGDAGNITINARNNVSLNAGYIFNNVEEGAEGNGGEVKIETGSLNLKGGGQIQTIVRKADPENNLPAGKGDAGNIIINARDAVTLDGLSSDGIFESAIASELGIGAIGKAGKIEITTGNLALTNSGGISSSTFGTGDGGNITINFKDTLKLRGGSLISAQAIGEANAGNININSPDGFIVAFPSDNNILATATQQKGGNISIDVNKVYGFDRSRIQKILSIEDRDRILSDGENDINSTSGKPELSGDINLNTDILDPAKERAKTNEQTLEPDEKVASACGSGDIAKENSFTIVGRGGLPQVPTEPLNSTIFAGNSKSLEAEVLRRQRDEKKTSSSDEIIPARGMTINEKGQVVLTRYPTPNTRTRSVSQSNSCSNRAQRPSKADRISNNPTSQGYIFSDNYLVGFN
jgi:filamentous hemagglutinin family protein